MTGNLFLVNFLASNVKKCENHTLIIVVDHKTCSVGVNFNVTFTVESRLYELPREMKIGSKNRRVGEIGGKTTVFD